MLEDPLAASLSFLVIDPSPLTVDPEDSLQQVMVALAATAKTYALVQQDDVLLGVLSYENAALAARYQVDFATASARLWMTPLEQLLAIADPGGWPPDLALPPAGSAPQPVVDRSQHLRGLVAHGQLHAFRSAAVDHGSATELAACYRTTALLHHQQERLALALEGAQMGTWDWNLATDAIVISDGQERLLGLIPGSFDGSYTGLFINVPREDYERVDQALQQAIRLSQRYSVEFRVCGENQATRWLSARGQVFSDGRQVPRLAGVSLDITDQKQVEAEIKLQSQRERLVANITQRIRDLLDLNGILAQTVDSVRSFIEADRVIVIRCGPDMGGEVVQESCAAEYPSMLGWALRDPWSVSPPFLEHYRLGRGLAVEDVHAQNLPPSQMGFLDYFHIQAEIVVPLLQEQELWGLLIAHQCRSPRVWRTADVRLLQNLANQVGIAIRQAQLHQELTQANQRLRRMAYLDGLTQVANRRRFEQYLDQEWRRMGRERGPLAVIMADIDCFKGFNDCYGHQAGDNCLRLVARTLSRAAKRPGDLVARYGGEEFVLVLPNTDLKGAESVAEEIRLLVRSHRIPHAASTVAKVVTMSLGVASAQPGPQGNPNILVKLADGALYQAKHEGRDQVRVAPAAS